MLGFENEFESKEYNAFDVKQRRKIRSIELSEKEYKQLKKIKEKFMNLGLI